MEDKRRETGSPSPATTSSGITSSKPDGSPSSEPPPPRRRAQKRKSTSNLSGSSSAPPKRHAREKAAAAAAAAAAGISSLLPPFHNGPLTRARQLSDNNAVLNAVKDDIATAATQDLAPVDRCQELSVEKKEEFEEFRAVLDAEFDAIRSRDVNAHVVPVSAGWFSWTEIHPLEKQTLHSFFNGKSENRTPEIYTEIRNWIMKKFHANPSSSIELKDLSELSVGDLDAREEVMEFLDHWGLINYHPSLQNDFTKVDASPSTDGDNAENVDSLMQKLYQFENELSYPELVPKANMSAQAMSTGLLRESAFADELIRQEGPSVEYHCNSCSADCSRKRYHCQKQADFDLCTECYSNDKFGSGMSSSDFILMEPGEASGASGGKWTDQETLLLLEALELFRENWNEIAEHVATKTKAQCILHFLQMPIEDVFLDNDHMEGSFKVTTESNSTNNDVPTDKDTSEPLDKKACKENSDQTGSGSGVDNPDPLAEGGKDDPGLSEKKTDASVPQPTSTPMETSNPEDAEDGKEIPSSGDDVILKALKEAFDAVGCPATPEDNLCFIETGNPVMSLAAFLTQLVQPSLATVSARSSLKSMSASSPGSQLAARHCFILEDPPDDRKEQTVSESMATVSVRQTAQKLSGENDQEGVRCEENPTNIDDQKLTSLPGGNIPSDDQIEKKGSDLGDKSELSSQKQDVHIAEKLDQEKSQFIEKPDLENSQAAERTEEDKSQISGKHEEEKSDVPEKPDEDKSKVTARPDQGTCSEQVGPKGMSQKKALHNDQSQTNLDGQDSSSKVKLNTGSENESVNTRSEVEVALDAPEDVNMEPSVGVSDKNEQHKTQLADPAGVILNTVEDRMEVDRTGNPKSKKTLRTIDGDNISRLKRAALATLSAAAVKAKLLANQEEDEIKQLATVLIEKQMRKLEIKLSFFTDLESAIMRVREQLERSKQKLFAERAQIIASRLGLPPSARGVPSSHTLNRMPAGLLNSVLRPSLNMAAQRPPMLRPAMTSAPPATRTSAPTEVATETSAQATPAENPSSIETS